NRHPSRYVRIAIACSFAATKSSGHASMRGVRCTTTTPRKSYAAPNLPLARCTRACAAGVAMRIDPSTLDRFVTDIVLVASGAIKHLAYLTHETWPDPHPRLRRDTIGDVLRHLVSQAQQGDFPSIPVLRKAVEWTLCELYWR